MPNTLSRESIPNTLSGVGAPRPVKPRRTRLSGVSAAVLVAFLVALAYLLWR